MSLFSCSLEEEIYIFYFLMSTEMMHLHESDAETPLFFLLFFYLSLFFPPFNGRLGPRVLQVTYTHAATVFYHTGTGNID